MTQKNENAVAVVTEQNKVTQELLLDFLKQTLGNLPQNQQAQFLAIAKAFNLNPWKREIYAVKYGDKFNVIVGYETYLKRAEGFPQFDGYETEIKGEGDNMSCTCTVYRKDRNHPTRHTVYLKEYRNGPMWNSKPKMMLEKTALSATLRRAFPLEFGGMPYTSEELGNLSDSEKLEQQGYQEVNVETASEAPVKEAANNKPQLTNDQKTANWLAMCEELRNEAPDVFDAYLKRHNVPDLVEIRSSKERQNLYMDIKETINATKETEEA